MVSLRRSLPALAALAIVLAAFSPRDLWPPDEPRYGEVAREMVRTGDWIVPSLNGAPYAEKPPLYFWVAAAVSLPVGHVTTATARLAAALLAAGSIFLVWRLARRWFRDYPTATTAALVTAGTGLFVWNAPRAGLDLPLTFLVLLAVDRASAWWDGEGVADAAWAGLAWGGAVLAKGPVGLVAPVVVMAGGALASRRAPRWRDPGWWLAPLLMAGVGLLWLLPAVHAAGPGYEHRLLGQIGSRAFGSEEEHHVHTVLYYLLRAGPLLLPFTLHALLGIGRALRPSRLLPDRRFGAGGALAGSVGLLVILSLVATKREQYMIPLVPFGSMLAALAIHQEPSRLGRVADLLLVVTLGVLGVAALASPFVVAHVLPEGAVRAFSPPGARAVLAGVLVAIPFVIGAVVWRRSRSSPDRARAAAMSMVLGALALQLAFLPLLDPVKSYAEVGRAAEQNAGAGGVAYGRFGQPGNLLWSLRPREIQEITDPAEIAAALAPDAPKMAYVTEAQRWDELLAGLRRSDPRLADLLAAARVAWRDHTGNRPLLVLTNP